MQDKDAQAQDIAQNIIENLKGKHIHFVGIKGTGMAALVEIFFHKGAIITGSDVKEKFYTDDILKKCNITPLLFSADNITKSIDLVIYSSAYSITQNTELLQATKLDIPCILYTKALGLFSRQAYSCGVCGVHGKTTTTGLIGTILEHLPLTAQVLAGSAIASFGGGCTYSSPSLALSSSPSLATSSNPKTKEIGEKHFFVAETCEYKKHFMDFCPKKIVLTSVESDHQDFYPTLQSIKDAFVEYCLLLPQKEDLIYCIDDAGAKDVANIVHKKRPDINLIAYGTQARGDYKITPLKKQAGEQKFLVGDIKQPFSLYVPGFHFVLNAVAAFALCSSLLKKAGKKIDCATIQQMQKGLQEFRGGKRRSEVVGHFTTKHNDSVVLIDDYAHHPTAINTTLKGYKDFYSGAKIIVDFMSHTYTRTFSLLAEFAKCFSACDMLIVNEIYGSARENATNAPVTGLSLCQEIQKHHPNTQFCADFKKAANIIAKEIDLPLDREKYPAGFLVVTMGAGNNWQVGEILKQMYSL